MTLTMTRAQILTKRVELLATQLREPEAADLEVLTNEATRSGYGRSGHLVMGRHERRLDTIQRLLTERICIEQDIGLAPEDEGTWHDVLVGHIHRILDLHGGRLREELENDSQLILGKHCTSFLEEVNGQFKSLRDQALLAADIMKGERDYQKRVPASAPTPSSITLNISHSQIAGLNVGGTVGTIQATVNTLQAAGAQPIAEALKALAEAIASAGLPNEVKRESLELVSVMGEELSRPADQRRPGVLRNIGDGLKQLLAPAGNAYAAYEILRAALKALGFDLP